MELEHLRFPCKAQKIEHAARLAGRVRNHILVVDFHVRVGRQGVPPMPDQAIVIRTALAWVKTWPTML